MIAAFFNNVGDQNHVTAAMRRLLEDGADPNEVNAVGMTPLILTVEFGMREAAELLISYGADVNGGSRRTPLHAAAENGHADMVELLVAKEADTDAVDSDGRTALDLAKDNGLKDVAEILTRHGA